MAANNKQTVYNLQNIQNNLNGQMEEIKKDMGREIHNMSIKAQKRLQKVEEKSNQLILNLKKDTLMYFWVDAFKYGLATSVVLIPLYFLIRSFFSSIGMELP